MQFFFYLCMQSVFGQQFLYTLHTTFIIMFLAYPELVILSVSWLLANVLEILTCPLYLYFHYFTVTSFSPTLHFHIQPLSLTWSWPVIWKTFWRWESLGSAPLFCVGSNSKYVIYLQTIYCEKRTIHVRCD